MMHAPKTIAAEMAATAATRNTRSMSDSANLKVPAPMPETKRPGTIEFSISPQKKNRRDYGNYEYNGKNN
jgi:hypothetical protein